MKMRPKIDLHDYNFKVRAIKDFLLSGFRVKVAVFFRGREMAFLDRGREVLDKVVRDCDGIGKVDMPPRMEGRYMRLMLMPLPQPARKPKTAETDKAVKLEKEGTEEHVAKE
jgi:translation initiation factor IF-3